MLGKATGIFSLNDSDNHVGSYFTIDDSAEILSVSASDIEFLAKPRDGIPVIDENELFKAWYAGKIRNSPPNKINNVSVSCDELILANIIMKTYPEAIIEHQHKVGRYMLDLMVSVKNKTVFIEFDGPSHFAPSRYGIPKNHPFKKKEIVEQATGIEVVNWAYWIQRCAANVKTLFNDNDVGYGALWSTKCHFGMFVFNDSADIIQQITRRFNSEREYGIGYFYESGIANIQKPEHPIVQQILNGKQGKDILLPKGFEDERYWLPAMLSAT